MPWALRRVLEDVGDVDQIVVGGDFVGGPCPGETVELVRSLAATCIRGNAERDANEWVRERLSADDVEWMQSLPLTVTIDGVLYCHATPEDDMPITTAITPDEALVETFAGHTGMIVIGHTHHQFDRRVGELRIVNAGSIGMPYEGRVAAFWTLVDDGEPQFRSTEVDVAEIAKGVLASGWPGAEEFVAENVRVAVDRDDAVRYFESIR
jgi:diadenosine tetraphosphatase ApaH/serine/threonine PP2A family protein phosphatase